MLSHRSILACCPWDETLKYSILFYSHIFPARNALLWTPIDCAAANGQDKLIELLVDASAEINPVDGIRVNTAMLKD